MLKDFVETSLQFSSPLHVQGGGGNTSLKLSEETMIIKASGTFLEEMTELRPGVKLDIQCIEEALKSGDFTQVTQEREDALNTIIDAHTDHTFFPDKKASIETSVHAIIPRKYVFHTHFVYSNVFATAVEGWEVLSSIWGQDIGLIPYTSPGLGLTLEIWKQYPDRESIPQILIFESHGIVFSADSLEAIQALYTSTQELLTSYLSDKGLEPFACEALEQNQGIWSPGYHLKGLLEGQTVVQHLFPDSVVFGQNIEAEVDEVGIVFSGDSIRKNKTIWENLSSMNYLRYAHEKLGWTSKFLSKSQEAYILDMGREKYRINLNK
ncbi:MAG TPA: class II aldolase/adducin family protein [Candidatus Gracilibacteria bacterium]